MMSIKPSVVVAAFLTLFATEALAPVNALAYERDHGRFREVRGHEERWRAGHWIHDRHEGRLGWWWVAGPAWYFYARPYAERPPQTIIIQQQPPAAPQPPVVAQAPTMYYCKATGTYYPDTMTCPGGWSPVVAGAPPAP
jgi:hypothetical protein